MKFIDLKTTETCSSHDVLKSIQKHLGLHADDGADWRHRFHLFLAIAWTRATEASAFFEARTSFPSFAIVSIGVVWQWLYNPEFGLINDLLARIGIDGPTWLTSDKTAMLSLDHRGRMEKFGLQHA